LNSLKKRFHRWKTVPFAAHGVPEKPFGDMTGRALQLRLRQKAAEGETKTKKRKGEETT